MLYRSCRCPIAVRSDGAACVIGAQACARVREGRTGNSQIERDRYCAEIPSMSDAVESRVN